MACGASAGAGRSRSARRRAQQNLKRTHNLVLMVVSSVTAMSTYDDHTGKKEHSYHRPLRWTNYLVSLGPFHAFVICHGMLDVYREMPDVSELRHIVIVEIVNDRQLRQT